MNSNLNHLLNPLITVIVPAYNRGEFLGRTLDSIFSTGYESLQVIVVDDESTDDTPNVVQPYLSRGAIEYYRIENDGLCGPASAINTGLTKARGEFIHCLDADDCVEPSYYREVLEVFRTSPNVDAVCSFASIIDPNDRRIGRNDYPDFNSPEEFRRNSLWGNQVISSSMITKRACYDEVGGRRPQYQICCDYDLWLRIGEQFNVHLIRKMLVRYRKHDKNISSSLDRIREYDQALLLDYIRRHPPEFFLPSQIHNDRLMSAKYLYALTLSFENRGFPALMEPFLLASIQRNPRDAESYAALAMVHYMLEDLGKTELYAHRALRFDSEHPRAKAILRNLNPPPYKPRNAEQPFSILLVTNSLAASRLSDPENSEEPTNSTDELAALLANSNAHVTVLCFVTNSRTLPIGEARWTNNEHYNLIEYATPQQEQIFEFLTDSPDRNKIVNNILEQEFDLIHFQQLTKGLALTLAKMALSQRRAPVTFALHDDHLLCSQLGAAQTLEHNNCPRCQKYGDKFPQDLQTQEFLFKTLQARQRFLQIVLTKTEAIFLASQNKVNDLNYMGFETRDTKVIESLGSPSAVEELGKALLQVLPNYRQSKENKRLAI